jgi:uncharacterized protein YuzE
MIKFTFDEEAKTAYLQLRELKVEISKKVEEGIVINYSEEGDVVGIEILPLQFLETSSIVNYRKKG